MPVSPERQRELRSQNREAYNAYQREHRKRNKDMHRGYEFKRNYGITLDDYNAILQAQGNVCAICGNPPGVTGTGNNSQGRLAVDHEHSTNFVRGLLCTKCNLGIGSFCDDIDLLQKAIKYLQEHIERVQKVKLT